MGLLSDKEGDYNAYVAPFSDPTNLTRVSPVKGAEPLFSQNTREIFYFTWGKKKLQWMVVPYKTQPTFKIGEPQYLFEGDYLDLGGRTWDVHPGGQRPGDHRHGARGGGLWPDGAPGLRAVAALRAG